MDAEEVWPKKSTSLEGDFFTGPDNKGTPWN
jgi:hypothetical protein